MNIFSCLFFLLLASSLTAQTTVPDWEKRFPTAKELTHLSLTAEGLSKAMTGCFSNEKQAQKDTSKSLFKSAVYIINQPIWQDYPNTKVRWILLSRFFKGQSAPYMQWIYRIEDLANKELSVQILFLPADIGGDFLNDWKKDKPLATYTPEQLEKANPNPCILNAQKTVGEETIHLRLVGDICRFPVKMGDVAGLYIDLLVKNTGINLRGDVLDENKKIVAAMGDQILLRLSLKEIKKYRAGMK